MLIALYIIVALVSLLVFAIFLNAISELDRITPKNLLIAFAISVLVIFAVLGDMCNELGSTLVEKIDD